MANEAGALRDGRYVLLDAIGEGAQGRTFDAVDKREGRRVAIKRFDVRGATSWKDVELAEREARVLQSLSHPRLPAYVEHFEEGGALYLVMDKIEGESLASLKRRGAPFDEEQAWRLLGDAAEVLGYLHDRPQPVIHRDLKPGNVIRRPDGSFAFVDFGAVRDRLRPKGGSTFVGTFGYMAPEQLQGRALPASDVYAVGATVVSMLSGAEPEDLPHRGLAIDVRSALRGKASPRLVAVLERMLDPDPDRRAARLAPLVAEGRRAAARGGRSQDARGAGRAEGRSARGEDWSADWRADRYQRWAEDLRDDVRRRVERRARRAARRAERAARRAARRAGRAAGPRRHRFPWPLKVLATVLILGGTVAVSVAMQVVVPLVLGMLSLLFAREALRRASLAVKHAGRVAVHGMQIARHWVVTDGDPAAGEAHDAEASPDSGSEAGSESRPESGSEPRRVRVPAEPSAAPGARVAAPSERHDRPRSPGDDEEYEEEDQGAGQAGRDERAR